MKKRRPMVAPGWISIPVKKRLICEMHPRHQRHAPAVEAVRQAVRQDGVEARIAEEDFEHALGGRIFPEDGVDLFPDGAEHCRAPSDARG